MALPDFSLEKDLWKREQFFVAGVDEVGRGCLSGPVVAGVVVWPRMSGKDINRLGINDSKKLTPKQREQLSVEIKKRCLYWSIGEASVTDINSLGIVRSTQKAMRRAVGNIRNMINKDRSNSENSNPNNIYLLLDAFYLKHMSGVGIKNQNAIIKGDCKSISIASASIVAKVYRDEIMRKLSKRYPEYGWERNMGYGTKEHRQALLKIGPCKLHRRLFISKIISSG
jgi:ribonuclease HII